MSNHLIGKLTSGRAWERNCWTFWTLYSQSWLWLEYCPSHHQTHSRNRVGLRFYRRDEKNKVKGWRCLNCRLIHKEGEVPYNSCIDCKRHGDCHIAVQLLITEGKMTRLSSGRGIFGIRLWRRLLSSCLHNMHLMSGFGHRKVEVLIEQLVDLWNLQSRRVTICPCE